MNGQYRDRAALALLAVLMVLACAPAIACVVALVVDR